MTHGVTGYLEKALFQFYYVHYKFHPDLCAIETGPKLL
jgi:hypothetical protein